MYNNSLKKELIKNICYVGFILLIAISSTYYIYYKFQDTRNVDFNSDTLDIVYHEKEGNKVSILKVTPVTDSVGLSSKSYNLTIKNNLTEKVDYSIYILDDIEKITEDECGEYQIPKEDIRISIKVGKKGNKIYTLSELESNELLNAKLNALEKVNISIRLWINKDSNLPSSSNLHYHGMLEIKDDTGMVASLK